MSTHFDVLGWLYVLGGAFGVVTGVSLLVLAGGADLAQGALGGSSLAAASVVWTLAIVGLLLVVAGALMVTTGRALLGRRASGRPAALWLGVLNLVVIPFGTALGVYTFWVLLNDDARRAFGRRLRGPGDPTSTAA
jgi:hypothetical protein